MAIILTNDDGIDAPGIQALRQAIAKPAIVVAPQVQHSGCGHQVTTTQPICVERRSEMEYAIAGTPADCTRLAITQFCQEISWVLSGINAGGNLGVDMYTSGTIAAVREAAMFGVPGIAISHAIKRPGEIDWDAAVARSRWVLAELMARPLAPGSFWNVNLPPNMATLEPGAAEPKLVYCQASTRPLAVAYDREGDAYIYRGVYGDRPRDPGTDVDVCFSGNIAVTLLNV